MLRYYIETKSVIPPESEDGNIEYKQRLDLKSLTKIKKMTSQMLWRLNEGKIINGRAEAHYFLGIDDNGAIANIDENIINDSINVLDVVAKKCHSEIHKIDKIKINDCCVAEIIIFKKKDGDFIKESRVCILGESGHGKTTLVSCLAFGQNDNGNGSGRALILKHEHEQNSGITSSLKHDIVGIKNGSIINYKTNIASSWENVVINSNKLIAITDTPGLSRFYKTTLYAIFSLKPHFNIIVVSPSDLIDNTPTELINNIKLSLSLNIPFILVFNKCDIVPVNKNILKMLNINESLKLTEYTDTFVFSKCLIPYVSVSCVNNVGMNMLISLIDRYSDVFNNKLKLHCDDVIFSVHHAYIVPDRGNILYGLLNYGKISINDEYYVGPIENQYQKIRVRSIHKKQIDSKHIFSDETASLELANNIYPIKNYNNLLILNESSLNKIKLSNKCNIEILENNNFLKIGAQYTVVFENVVEPIVVIGIETKLICIEFLKKDLKPIRSSICAIIDNKNELLIGKIMI